MGGKLLLRIETILNVVGLKILFFFFPPQSGSLLHFLLQRNPFLPYACCDDPFRIKGMTVSPRYISASVCFMKPIWSQMTDLKIAAAFQRRHRDDRAKAVA